MASPLRVVFAGTPQFAAVALEAIHAAGFSIPLVLTQPDRPAGRKLQLTASPVKQFALEHDLPIAQPISLRRNGKFSTEAVTALEQLRATPYDVMVVVAYGLLLPQEVLEIPRYGCINIHGSLLPRWRGAAPIQRALEAGDTQTGITLIQMDAGLDTGPILSSASLPIEPLDTAATLYDKLSGLGAQLMVEKLHLLARDGSLPSTAQASIGVTYAHKLDKQEAILDWKCPAEILAQRIRAFDPFPGSRCHLNGTEFKIWAAHPLKMQISATPGEILKVQPEGVTVACGEDALCITLWQKPGGKRLATRELLAGFTMSEGQRFN